MLGEATKSQKQPLELPVKGKKRLSWLEFARRLAIYIPTSVMWYSAGKLIAAPLPAQLGRTQ